MSDNERRRSTSPKESRDTDRKERDDSGSRDCRRNRSRSPITSERKPRRKDAGFKWKEKRRDEDNDLDDRRRDRNEGLKRGYRDQYKQRSRSRSRSPPRRHDSYRGEREQRDHKRDYRDRDSERDRKSDSRQRYKEDNHTRGDRPKRDNRDDEKSRKPLAPPPAMPQQEMILVTVNDRLGTKKQVPCLPTDTIKDFKAVVAMMIGRRPHEILLKRQSERPFKDFLTLQDYGISNNVQLDLEVDTGD